ncbi:MAG: hypothetical protein Q7R54_00605 [bacterium]|nr:hypothetical protein [bacterium]
MIERVMKAVLRRMRETLGDGYAVAIVGWRDSNHNQFTRELPADKVVFTDDSEVPSRVHFALITRFVSHTTMAGLKKRTILHNAALETGEIKRLLEGCADLLATPVRVESAASSAVVTPKIEVVSPLDAHHQILEYLTEPQQELSDMQKFVADFLRAAANNNGAVSTKTVAKLRDEHHIVESATLLSKTGWLVAEAGSGKQKIGWYRAGEKILAMSKGLQTEPTDPIERAKFLIAQKETLLAEQDALESQTGAVSEKLDLIEQAEELLSQLAEPMKK